MSYTFPNSSGIPVIDLTNANFGATNFPPSPNSSGKTSTAVYETTLNISNIGKPVPSNAGTT
jgi:hypothetical protein